MLAAFALIRQAARLDLTAQRINVPQHVFESNGRLASFKVDDGSTRPNPATR